MKLSPTWQKILFVTLMVLAMSFVISLGMSLAHMPLNDAFLGRWLRNWALSIVIAWPTAYLVVPAVRRIVAKLS